MRRRIRLLALHSGAAVLLLASGGCSSKTAPASTNTATPVARSPGAQLPPLVAPAAVLFTSPSNQGRRIVAVAEDLSGAPITLSAAGTDTTFVAALPDRRALLAERADDGSVVQLVAVSVTGGERASLGTFPAAQYQGTGNARAADDGTVLVELTRTRGSAPADLFALHVGAPPILLAKSATLEAESLGRVAFLSAGNLKSVALDGTQLIALGGGDGQDAVASVTGGSRLLVNLHSAGSGALGDVRLITIDGTHRVDLGSPTLDESAFGISDTNRVVYSRRTDAGAVLVSTAVDGSDERVLTAPAEQATPLYLGDRGLVFFGTVDGGLSSVNAAGGKVTRVDAAAGSDITVSRVLGTQVVYTGHTASGLSLRASKLDGSATTILCERPLWLPFVTAVFNDGPSSSTARSRVSSKAA